MERLIHRSTSLSALQAEIRRHDLLEEAQRVRILGTARQSRRPTLLGLPLPFGSGRRRR